MQYDIIKSDRALAIVPQPIELVLSEEGATRLSFVLPPFEDIAAIQSLTGAHFSLKERAEDDWRPFKNAFAAELAALERKEHRFSESKTFLTHLANLSELAGDRTKELEVLDRLPPTAQDDYFARLRGENLHATGRHREAEALFLSLASKLDPYANLRMAYYYAQRNDLASAESAVSRTIATDPLSYGGRLFEGALRLASGRYQEALYSFRIAAEERPQSSVLHTNMAIAYLFLRKNDRALTCLRKSVALDPLNQNALELLADAANKWGRDEDAVPALRYFLNLEQRIPSIWGKLARSLLRLGRPDEALSALRRQASHEDTSAVWNNIGVAHVVSKNRQAALSAFNHSISKATDQTQNDALLAVRNALSLLVDSKEFDTAIRTSRSLLQNTDDSTIVQDRRLSDIYCFYFHSLRGAGRLTEAFGLAESLVSRPETARSLRIWLVSQLVSHYALVPNQAKRALELAQQFAPQVQLLEKSEAELVATLANNITFAFAELGYLDDARRMLPAISQYVHKRPYQTATLGLVKLRSGKFDKAAALYEEAIRLAVSSTDKTRIRQKLNLEHARHLLSTNARQAERYLRKVEEDERQGSGELAFQAKALRQSLTERS